jgi:aconitate hydratase
MSPSREAAHLDSFGARTLLDAPGGRVAVHRLARLEEEGLCRLERLPFSVRILLEAVLRCEDGVEVTREDVVRLATYDPARPAPLDLPFKPARVLLQDFTGVPVVVDLAAMRSALARMGGDPSRVNPLIPVDLVVDHSVQVDYFGSSAALEKNADLEFERNRERYTFLRWGQRALRGFRVVPPASGIVHQVNLEHLATVVVRRPAPGGDGLEVAFPDSLVGTDSHTTMINGLGVLGWGVGGIEAEAVMLGQPYSMLAPEVVGVRLEGALPEGSTATDLVLFVTELLRRMGVVGKFVEFFGRGLGALSLPDRATIANMAPEYGATVGFFPVDEETLRYLRRTGRPRELVELVEWYSKAQGLFREDGTPDPIFAQTVSLDLGSVVPSVAGPKRPQDRVALSELRETFARSLRAPVENRGFGLGEEERARRVPLEVVGGAGGERVEIGHGHVAIAAITSCTNTSNPAVMLAAGLLAKKAVEAGLRRRPWVKSSLAPGSRAVTEYLARTGLLPSLEALGFNTVGYGCTTCIGNSGPLPPEVVRAVEAGKLVVASVLSGNRNFEGRINPHVRANFLASPPLVVAFALAGTVEIDLDREPLGRAPDGREVFLRDVWPSAREVAALLEAAADPETYRRVYAGIGSSNEAWNRIPVPEGDLFAWDAQSTYIQEPPFFEGLALTPPPLAAIERARVLVWVGDSVTTDHISPAGSIAASSPAGRFLAGLGVAPADFNSYGSRRGNDRVMTRGTFANIRLKNRLAPGTEGGFTTHLPSGEVTTIFEASRRYLEAGVPTLVLAGRDYGMGSSRDWAAKGAALLGVRAVLAASFERIHRSNLVGMGVLPLELEAGQSAESLGLTGRELFTIPAGEGLAPGQQVRVEVLPEGGGGAARSFAARCRIDTPLELESYRGGGILPLVLRRFLAEGRGAA